MFKVPRTDTSVFHPLSYFMGKIISLYGRFVATCEEENKLKQPVELIFWFDVHIIMMQGHIQSAGILDLKTWGNYKYILHSSAYYSQNSSTCDRIRVMHLPIENLLASCKAEGKIELNGTT